MNEKVIVKSEQYNVKRICISIFIILALLLNLVLFDVVVGIYAREEYKEARQHYVHDRNLGYESLSLKEDMDYYLDWVLDDITILELISIGSATIVSLIVYFWLAKTELVVSNKRVYGKTVFGKRVDLPLDSISAIGSKWPRGVAVATSSGRIAFLMVKNRDEIHKCVSNLLIERQTKHTATMAIKQEAPKSDADELKKYKELLDSGIITQEEFNAKKKQLLGL